VFTVLLTDSGVQRILLIAFSDAASECRTPLALTCDVEGAVWIAVRGTGTVRRYLPDGTLDRTLRLPARQPAGVCLADDVLHITTARVGLAAPGDDDGALFTARVDVPGTPTPARRLSRRPRGGRTDMTRARTSPATAPWRPAPGPVVCIGETMAALAPDPPSPLLTAAQLRLSVAGAESNVAMYPADHGIDVAWLSALGDDPLGDRVRATVAAPGVDVSHVRTDPDRPAGQGPGPRRNPRALLPARLGRLRPRPGPAGRPARPHGLAVAPDRHHARAVRVLPPAGDSRLTAEAGARPYAVSFDVNHRAALWRDGTAPAVLRESADRADIVFVGLDEARALWGGQLTARDVRARLPRPRVLVVKDGRTPRPRSATRAPSRCRHRARRWWRPSAPAMPSRPDSWRA
jgi:2-dehydro-3-deoxygluconokinase